MTLKERGEFGLIDEIAAVFSEKLPPHVLGIGDDCAVFPRDAENSWIVTTDCLVENIHFIKEKIKPQELGFKSLAVNLSDIAAMGGVPSFFLLTLALPLDTSDSWLQAFLQGIHEAASTYKVSLIGGDTIRSVRDIFVSITAIGTQKTELIKKRSTAKPGDKIFVTDFLGDSAGGLQIILKQGENEKDGFPALIEKHVRPEPQLEIGQWLAAQKPIHAMMDISDGIDSDLRRIMASSGCGAKVDLDKLPLSADFKRFCSEGNRNASILAATGGEDYCLLATVDPEKSDDLKKRFQKHFGRNIFEIGEITSSNRKLEYFLKGAVTVFSQQGWDHFKMPNK